MKEMHGFRLPREKKSERRYREADQVEDKTINKWTLVNVIPFMHRETTRMKRQDKRDMLFRAM
jgi:hypothetical protein